MNVPKFQILSGHKSATKRFLGLRPIFSETDIRVLQNVQFTFIDQISNLQKLFRFFNHIKCCLY